MNAQQDFEFVLRVLKSSTEKSHLKTSENLFENFKSKWNNKIECFVIVDYMFKFHLAKKKQKDKIKKK